MALRWICLKESSKTSAATISQAIRHEHARKGRKSLSLQVCHVRTEVDRVLGFVANAIHYPDGTESNGFVILQIAILHQRNGQWLATNNSFVNTR